MEEVFKWMAYVGLVLVFSGIVGMILCSWGWWVMGALFNIAYTKYQAEKQGLLPCPFCGAEAHYSNWSGGGGVYCTNCGAKILRDHIKKIRRRAERCSQCRKSKSKRIIRQRISKYRRTSSAWVCSYVYPCWADYKSFIYSLIIYGK